MGKGFYYGDDQVGGVHIKEQVIKLSDLKRVKGIGEKTIQRIRETLLTEKDNRNDLPVIRKDIQEFKDKFICGDNVEVLRQFPNDCIDLTVTSPPYDNLRTYNGFEWDFKGVANELYRVTKPGGVVVWVVGDATINGSETGTSFRQALGFMDAGFKLHDTMIYLKSSQPRQSNRYEQQFEYMFVLTKGKPQAFNPIKELSKNGGKEVKRTCRDNGGDILIRSAGVVSRYKIKSNVWFYGTKKNMTIHPAIFPEQLANDHIISWSNPGDIVLDPFGGSGTTAKMSILNDRHFIYIDCSQEYCDLAKERVTNTTQDVVNGVCNALQV